MDTKLPEPPIIPQFYANLNQIAASPSDISITLGVSGVAPLGGTENAPPTTVAVLRLSAPAANMLMLNLQQMLTLYEARFSKIYVPREFEEALHDGAVALGLEPKPGVT